MEETALAGLPFDCAPIETGQPHREDYHNHLQTWKVGV